MWVFLRVEWECVKKLEQMEIASVKEAAEAAVNANAEAEAERRGREKGEGAHETIDQKGLGVGGFDEKKVHIGSV